MAKKTKLSGAFKTTKERVVLDLTVDPAQGITRLAISLAPPGYALEKAERRGSKAKLTFRRMAVS